MQQAAETAPLPGSPELAAGSHLHSLLKAVRRRLRLAWGVATGQLLMPWVLLLAALLTGLGRLRPLTWADPAALVAVGAAIASLAVWAASKRVPLGVAARAADRALRTKDAFATALELGPPGPDGNPFAAHVAARAARLTAGRTARDAIAVRIDNRRAVASVMLVIAVVALAVLPNVQDEVRRRQAAEQALLREEGRRLEEAAAALRRKPAGKAAARELEKLARELAAAKSLAQGRQTIDRAAEGLAGRLDPNLLALKAAVRGLDRSLAAQPLPSSNAGSASQQLQAVAAALSKLSPEERAAVAERLAALAATQDAGARETAAALREAAEGLRLGDAASAAAALSRGASAHVGASGRLAGHESKAAALGALALAQSRVAAGPSSAGAQAQGQGKGQAQGKGQGKGGGGRGGAAGSGASGKVGGATGPTGNGRGGRGSPEGTGAHASVGLQTTTVYDPARSRQGRQVDVEGRQGEGPSEITGKEQGPTRAGDALVPLERVFPRYRDEASRALATLDIPPSLRALVRAYFESLAES